LQNILYETLFAINFVKNICKFYNFVKNDYLIRNYLSLKILIKKTEKKILTNFLNKFTRKISCKIKRSNNVSV